MNMAINIQSILIVLGIGLVTGLLLGKIFKMEEKSNGEKRYSNRCRY